jgi:hypothetical protein
LLSVTNDQRPSAVATTEKGLPGTGTVARETAPSTGAGATAVSQALPARTWVPCGPVAEGPGVPHPHSPLAASNTSPVRQLTLRSMAANELLRQPSALPPSPAPSA